MLHPFLNPNESSFPSRIVYAKHSGTSAKSGASGSSVDVASVGSAQTPEQLRIQLAALEGQVSQEEARKQLEGLKGGMELQQPAQQQEAQEVNYVMSQLRTSLEAAPERKKVMDSIQNRLTLELAVLVEDNEITEAQLAPNALQSTLTRLEKSKGTVKIKTATGERNLYTHEQSLLSVPGLLRDHSNEEVKKAWEQMSQSMQQNVRLMRAASRMVGGQTADQSLTGKVSAGLKNAWEGIVDRWKNGTKMDKAMIIAGGAAAVGLLFSLGKRLFGSGGSKKGALFGLLGVGAALSGGVYLYNRLMNPLKAFDQLKALIPGMSRAKFTAGLTAYMSGKREAARAAWGKHYDVLSQRLGSRPTDPSNQRKEITVGSEKVGTVPAREALKNYAGEFREALFPIKNLLDNNPATRNMLLMYLSATHHAAIIGGFSMTAAKAMAFAKLAVTAPAHPLRSLMVISAFMLAKGAEENLRLPENSDALKRFLKGYIREKGDKINDFIEEHDLGASLNAGQLSLSAQYLTGDKDIKDLQPTALEMLGDVVDNSIDYLRLNQSEKEALRTRTGIRNLRDQLSHVRVNEEGLSESDKQKTKDLIEFLNQVLRGSRERNISKEELETLVEKGKAARVGVKREKGTLFWGYTNRDGEFLNKDNLFGLGIDPEASESEKINAASNFVIDQSSASQVIAEAVSRTLLERGRTTIAGAIDLVKNGNGMVVIDGARTLVVDMVTNAFWEIPGSLKDMFIAKLSGDQHASDVGFKELTFAYTGGLASYMVVGGRRALNPMRFMRLWKDAGLKGAMKPLIETAFWPLTVANRGQSFTRSRVLNPLFRGRQLGYKGVLGVVGETGSRGLNWVKSLNGLSRKQSAYVELSKLHRALADMRTAETMALEVGGKGEARKIVEGVVETFKKSTGESLSKVAIELSDTDIMGNIRLLQNSINNASKSFTLRASMFEVTAVINAGQTLGPEHFSKIKNIAANTHMKKELRTFLANLEKVGPGEADEIMRLLSMEDGIAQAASKLEKFGVLNSADDALRWSEEALENSGKLGRLIDSTIDVIKRGGKASKDGVLVIWNALKSERASALYKRAWEGLSSLPGAKTEKISSFVSACANSKKWGQLKRAISRLNIFKLNTAAEAVDTSTDLARAAVAAETAIDASADLARGSGVAIDTAQTAAQTLRGLDGALDAMKNGKKLSYLNLRSLQQAAQGENFVQSLRNAGIAAEHVDEVALLFREQRELGALVNGLEGTGALKIGNGVKGILKIARFAGPAMATAGLVAGGFEAWQAWGMAEEYKSNPELRDIYNNRGNANMAAALASFSVDAAMMAGRLGSLAAIPLTVIIENIRYVANAAMDASAEISKSDDDWLKEASKIGFAASGVDAKEWARLTKEGVKLDAHQMSRLLVLNEMRKSANKQYLLHALVNTTHDTGAGEAYNAVFSWDNTMDTFRDGRQETMSKLLSAIIKIDSGNNPVIYNQYRMKYINAKLASFDNIEKAREAIDASIIFADIMQNREQTLDYTYEEGAGKRTISLSDSKFDADKISIGDIYAVVSSAKQVNEAGLEKIVGKKLLKRIHGLDKNYLNYAVNVMMMYSKEVLSNSTMGVLDSVKTTVSNTAEMIRRFLMFNGYQFTRIPSLSDPEAHMEDINKVFFNESTTEESLKDAMVGYVPRSKGEAAIFVYAKATGFKGTVSGLRDYFIEPKKDWLGLYFRKDADLPGGGEWVVNEEGLESDNEAGSNPDVAALAIIRIIREEPDNILTSRFDYITDLTDRDDEARRSKWMLELARRMERAYGKSSAPENKKEMTGSGSIASNFFSVDTWKESMGETADTITEGISSAVSSTREAVGGVITSTGDALSSVGNAIGDFFSSDDDDDG